MFEKDDLVRHKLMKGVFRVTFVSLGRKFQEVRIRRLDADKDMAVLVRNIDYILTPNDEPIKYKGK